VSLVDFAALGLPAAITQELERLSLSIFFTGYSSKGANGETFFGVNVQLCRRIAIKFYYCGRHSRFHAEPQALAAVTSPNIIDVLDARLVGDEWALFLMPFCERGDLDSYLSEEVPSLHSGLDMAVGMGGGVAALHASRMLHRDLKPENLLLTDEGRLVIGDFGSVYRLSQGQDDVVGSGHTILYRPPESFDGGGYDTSGDIYQCGLTLYQMLGGQLPYEADAWIDRQAKRCIDATDDPCEKSRCVDAAIRRKIQSSRLLNIGSLPPTVPEAARRAIRKATRPAPGDRFRTCAELIQELGRVRAKCLDWRSVDGTWEARTKDRTVRVVPVQSAFRVEQNLGRGWRRLGTLGQSDDARLVVIAAERHFHA
jgi:serine/threonine protein kinase